MAEGIFPIEVGALPVRFNDDEPHQTRHRDKALALARRPSVRSIGPPLAFETNGAGCELEMTFPLRVQLTITKLESLLL